MPAASRCTPARTLIGVAADDRVPTASEVPTLTPDDADGHRMCGFVFASTVDLELWPPAAEEPWLHITARPRFFSDRDCA